MYFNFDESADIDLIQFWFIQFISIYLIFKIQASLSWKTEQCQIFFQAISTSLIEAMKRRRFSKYYCVEAVSYLSPVIPTAYVKIIFKLRAVQRNSEAQFSRYCRIYPKVE